MQVKYEKNKKLHEYEPDVVVEGVPVKYFDNDIDAMRYFKRYDGKEEWESSLAKLESEFDPIKFGEIFYCLKCERMEDGAHRRALAIRKGITHVSVRTGSDCYKNYVKTGRLIRGDSTFINTFTDMMREIPTEHRLDGRWLLASAGDKWPFISNNVDFKGKSFLDAGCNVGYSCVMAWSKMATECTGIDIRSDVLCVGASVKNKLKAPDDKITFYNYSFLNHLKKYDIVMSMGLLHYFNIAEYEKALNKLISLCKETLIIEIRFRRNLDVAKLAVSGIQTLPTELWIKNKLHDTGFLVTGCFYRDSGKRAIFIAKRIKE